MQAVELAEPVHQLGLRDPPGVLERSAGADRHPVRVVLDPRPGRRTALDQLDDQGGGHGALDRGAAGLALALPVVPVADREQRALDVDTEVDGGSGTHLRGVHVAAEAVGDQRAAHLPAGRGDPDGAEHRLQRQVDLEVAEAGIEGDGAAGPVQLVDVGRVGQRVLQRHDPVGAGHPAEERDVRRCAPVAGGLEADQVQGERVARFGALDEEGAGLGVHEAQVDLLAGQVGHRPQLAAERVVGPQPQRRPGAHPAQRCSTAEGVGVLLDGRHDLHDVHGRTLEDHPGDPGRWDQGRPGVCPVSARRRGRSRLGRRLGRAGSDGPPAARRSGPPAAPPGRRPGGCP